MNLRGASPTGSEFKASWQSNLRATKGGGMHGKWVVIEITITCAATAAPQEAINLQSSSA